MLAEAGSDDEIVVEVEKMTREAGIMAGIIPITPNARWRSTVSR